MLVPHGAYILALDGGHMRLFRNQGSNHAIRLETVKERKLHNPRTHVIDDDQPGRSFQSVGGARSAYPAADTHQRREDEFCEAALGETLAETGDAPALILIAPPRVMGVVRKQMERERRLPPTQEIVKDLTKVEPKALEEWLRAHH